MEGGGLMDMGKHGRRHSALLAGVCLTILTLVVYWKVQDHAFLVWDDYEYVVDNPHVRTGLNPESAVWAFTSAHASNWHPLTWLSHMLDCELYGLNPSGHHLNNLLLHLINTILLFTLFERMTRDLWRSAFVAAIFALHPLHVEPVAWVAERKELLSTFFFMLTCLAYLRYTRHSGYRNYFLCMVLFALGLASKPMLVTLPLILLLLDYWPLSRTGPLLCCGSNSSNPVGFTALFVEKLPLFALSALSGLVTIYSSMAGQATASFDMVPMGMRIGNALVSYSMYLIKAFCPVDLAFFYPHPLGTLPIWKVVGSFLFLLCVSLILFKARKKRPYLLVGWLWFGITLLPVIGLIQVGSQARADRYTYVPLIGISIMVAWGAASRLRKKGFHAVAISLGSAVVFLLSLMTARELRHWRNGEILFQRALQVTTGNYTAHYQLGNEYMRQGKKESAIYHFSEAVRFRPDHFLAHQNLGLALASQERFDQALEHLNAAIRIQPRNASILSSMGDIYLTQNRLEQSISSYFEALAVDPLLWRVHNNVGLAFLRKDMAAEAANHFEEALRLNPGERKATNNLNIARKKMQINE